MIIIERRIWKLSQHYVFLWKNKERNLQWLDRHMLRKNTYSHKFIDEFLQIFNLWYIKIILIVRILMFLRSSQIFDIWNVIVFMSFLIIFDICTKNIKNFQHIHWWMNRNSSDIVYLRMYYVIIFISWDTFTDILKEEGVKRQGRKKKNKNKNTT